MTTRQHIRVRRDTAANWLAVNPVLQDGEIGYETDTRRLKIGDGITAWSGLQYVTTLNAVRIDTTTPATQYVGKAPSGSAEAAAAWRIVKSTFTAAGVLLSSAAATNVTWTGRTGHTYS